AADGANSLHLPRVLPVLPVCQRADGADLDAHAAMRAIRVIEGVPERGDDRALETAVRHRDRGGADHLLAGADTLRALDTEVRLVAEGRDQHANLLGRVDDRRPGWDRDLLAIDGTGYVSWHVTSLLR